jgi:hypothetical protein
MNKRQNAVESTRKAPNIEQEQLKTLRQYQKMLIRSKRKIEDNKVLLDNTTAHIQSDNKMLNSDIDTLEKEIKRLKKILNI